MKRVHTVLASTLLGLIALSSAYAADGAAKADGPVAQACSADVEKLCPGTTPGDGRIKACIRKNHSKLSDGCKEALKAQRKSKGK